MLKLSPTPSPSLSPPSFCVDSIIYFQNVKKKKKDVSVTITTSVKFKGQSFDDGKWPLFLNAHPVAGSGGFFICQLR